MVEVTVLSLDGDGGLVVAACGKQALFCLSDVRLEGKCDSVELGDRFLTTIREENGKNTAKPLLPLKGSECCGGGCHE